MLKVEEKHAGAGGRDEILQEGAKKGEGDTINSDGDENDDDEQLSQPFHSFHFPTRDRDCHTFSITGRSTFRPIQFFSFNHSVKKTMLSINPLALDRALGSLIREKSATV